MELDARGNVKVNDYATSIPGVYSAGDTAVGASLVVTAIDAGRQAAAQMHNWLMGH
jgi:glutamate synthase (NADPH/NADH) small chain